MSSTGFRCKPYPFLPRRMTPALTLGHLGVGVIGIVNEDIGRFREARRVTEFVGELCGVRFPDSDSVQLRAARHDARTMTDQIQRAAVDLLRVECQAQLARRIILNRCVHSGALAPG